MTDLQAISHLEQMEAARVEFDRVWKEKIKPHCLSLSNKTDQDTLSLLYIAAWGGFIAGKFPRP